MENKSNIRKIKLQKINFKNKQVRFFLIIAMFIMFAALGVLLGLNYNKRVHAKIMYRTYTKENGWTNWVTSGKNCGVKGKSITAIQVKMKSKYNGHIFYNTYYKNKWSTKNTYDGSTSGNKKKGINGFYVLITDDTFDRYNVYYTAHNKHDGWLNYAANSEYSGNGKYEIDIIRIVVKKKDDLLFENLNKEGTINVNLK